MAVSEKSGQSDVFKHLEIFGRFHIVQYFLICVPLMTVAMTHINYIFVAEEVNYRCRVPECDTENSTVDIPTWWPSGVDVDTKCFKPVLENASNISTCTNTSFIGVFEECHEWIYENNNSIFADLNLGCKEWKASLVGSIHNCGMIFSMLLTGWIADKIGRKPTLIICIMLASIGAVKAFLTNYYAYITIEFLESFLASGIYTVGVVLLIEVGGDSKRVTSGILFSYAVYIGEILFAVIAMGLRYWKYIILVVYAPMTLFLGYAFILKESTRWQMLRGRMVEAKTTLKQIARTNKLEVTEAEIEDIEDEKLREKFNVVVQKEKENIRDILNSKEIVIRTAVSAFCFFASSFMYFGCAVHAVLLPGDKYTNFILASATAFPGDLLAMYLLDNIGRKLTMQCGYIVGAIFLMAQNYAPATMPWVQIMLFMIGKVGVVICFTCIYTYSLELFPTSVRGSLVGFGNMFARIGSTLAPLTPLLTTESTMVSSILFSLTAVVATVLLIFTPETKVLPLFDTIEQIEAYNNKKSTHL